jgi:hypothetical protein
MSNNNDSLRAERIRELGGREATLLQQDCIRVVIDDIGGMIPELSNMKGKYRLNAHWIPWFRGNSAGAFGAEEEPFWKANLLYHLAGNFPCVPNFGGDNDLEGMTLPPHGWTANLAWRFCGKHTGENTAWAVSTLESPMPELPLAFKKIDALIKGQAIHYTSLEVANNGKTGAEISAAWHNTVGAPFLQNGCIISGAADRWMTVPKGGEFDYTARLALGAEFASLEAAPLASGGTENIALVPGPIAYTDLVCGVIPASASLGWSALVNPHLKMVYACFFTGEAAAAEDEIILRYNDLWMQYGGRRFTPWALSEGGTDISYCLGTENSAAGFPFGLRYARETKKLMGAPTTVYIPAGKSRILRYATLFAPYEGSALDNGVHSIAAENGGIMLSGKSGGGHFAADPDFGEMKKLEAQSGFVPGQR